MKRRTLLKLLGLGSLAAPVISRGMAESVVFESQVYGEDPRFAEIAKQIELREQEMRRDVEASLFGFSEPTHYTSVEGQLWKPWTHGPVTLTSDYPGGMQAGTVVAMLETDHGVEPIHSLKFEDGTRWDVVNGWTPQVYPLVL